MQSEKMMGRPGTLTRLIFRQQLDIVFWICHVVCKGYNVYPCYICQTVDGTLFAVPVIYFYN